MNLIWKLEEKTYQLKALLEVVQDGLCNDVVGINQDHYATVIRVAVDKIDEIQFEIEEDYRQRRENMKDEEEYEDDEDDKTDADKEDVPGWRAKSDLFTGEIVSDEESEESEVGEESNDRFATGSFGVALVQEHDDGSATFEVHGSKEQMQKLFSAFFADAITRGIDSAEEYTNKWTTEKQIVKKAIELEKALKTWESVDEFDYDPEVRKIRKDLTDLIIAYGAER